jgi:hypothetical protein
MQISGKTAKIPLSNPLKSGTFKIRGSEMVVKVKLVQPTETKDKEIDLLVIEHIRTLQHEEGYLLLGYEAQM